MNLGLLLPSQQQDASGHVLTHGYVHGHVHQHRDHVHIHGHIHNHDHGEPAAGANHSGDASHDTSSRDYAPLSQRECAELARSLDLCDDIFCDDLDDCYWYRCDAPDDAGTAPPPGHSVCADGACVPTDVHDNSLCESQRPRLTIFEDLIQNVHRNLEQLGAAGDAAGSTQQPAQPPATSAAAGLQLHLHFPHLCHQEHVLPTDSDSAAPEPQCRPAGDHRVHQSCFHARLPLTLPELRIADECAVGEPVSESTYGHGTQQDYDFFVQFNNFSQLFVDPAQPSVPEPVLDDLPHVGDLHPKPVLSAHQHKLHPGLAQTYLCQWENCLQPVDNESLIDHLLGTHLSHDHPANAQLECEWDDCHFIDTDELLFLAHLKSHKHDTLRPSPLPLPTPGSLDLPQMLQEPQAQQLPGLNVGDGKQHAVPVAVHGNLTNPCVAPNSGGAVQILEMHISPKRSCVSDPPDPLHTCRWQIGTKPDGLPTMCGKRHESAGELQEHLKNDHIGRGKSIYHCCWVGCERNHGKPFTQRQKVFRHIHVHTGHRPCVCDICGARFAVPSLLALHQRIHLGEKPFECPTCGRCFATRSALAIHKRIHSDSRPLVCSWPGCGKRFRESTNLSKHFRTHGLLFHCDHCGRNFESRRALSRHMKIHATDSTPEPGALAAQTKV